VGESYGLPEVAELRLYVPEAGSHFSGSQRQFRSALTCVFPGEHTVWAVLAGSQKVRGSNPLGSTSTETRFSDIAHRCLS
jgi:hypothetical protein